MDGKTKKKEELKETLLENLNEMKSVRVLTEQVRWEACALVKHRTSAFNLTTSQIPAIPLHSTAQVDAVETSTAGIMGYLISQNIRWFNFTTMGKDFQDSDDIQGAKDYLEQVISMLLSVFEKCNFYSATELATKDAFVQGTSAEMIIDNTEDDSMFYDTIDPQEFYIAEDEHRRVDTFYRVYEMTARAAYKKWGSKLPQEVIKLVKDKAGHRRVKFLHAIYPREDALGKKGKAIISTEKKFASVHYSYTGDAVFKESGFDEFPVAVHRWMLNGTSPYGSSPVIKYIEEIKKLDKMELLYATGADKGVNPPVFAPEVLKGKLNLNPGAKNYLNIAQTGRPELFPSSLDLNHMAAQIQYLRNVISKVLYANLFDILMRQDKERTATEVREIKGEGLVLLSSIIGNMQEEKIAPLVMRSYHILKAAGKIPPPPEELLKASEEGRVKISLDGPLAQNMKTYHQTTGITQGMEAIEKVMLMFPDSQVQIEGDELMRQAASANGMPQTIIREKAQVKKIKEEQKAILEQQRANEQKLADAEYASKMQGAQGSTPQQIAQGQVGR